MSVRTGLRNRLHSYRNPVYIAYSLAGLLIFLLGLLIVRGGVGVLETHLFRFFNLLPGMLEPIFRLISLFGTIGFVAVATIISLFRRHYSHAMKFLLAGVTAWLSVKWIKGFELRARPSEILPNTQLREALDSTIGYPSGHAAVATALGVVAYMYVPKKYHRYITWLIILVCISRLYLGMHLPVDVIGGFGIGLVIASVINYAFGDTQGKHVPTQLIKQKLSFLNLDIAHVSRASVDARGSTPFFVTLSDKSGVFVKVVDTSNNVADWLFKISRKVLYRRLEDEAPFLTPKRQLEHEAYVAGLALANGVSTPQILGIFHVKEDMWGMGQVMIPGKSLDKIDPPQITKRLLTAIWKEVATLHTANIIHRDLRAANIFVDNDNKPWIIDFGFSEASVSSESFHRDTVELIASLSCLVDPKLVIETALPVIGKDEIKRALPYLDYASLSGATTSLLKSRKGLLAEIKQVIEKTIGVPTTKPIKIKRFDAKAALYIAMLGVALYVLLPQIADLSQGINALENSKFEYLFAAVLCSILTYPAAAGVYMFISLHPLKFLRTLLITISTSFTNRLLPASTGAIATNIRYLNKSGYSPTQATSITALNNLVGVIGHLTILFVVAGLSNTSLKSLVIVPISRTLIIIVGLIIVATIATIILVKQLRKKAVKIANTVRNDMKQLFTQPARFIFALLCAMTITSLYALTLYFSADAVGYQISILEAFFVFTIGIATASVTPTPGGIGGAEAGLVAGFASIGVPADIALSISLIYRFFTFWLPIPFGFIAFRTAEKQNYI